MYKEVDKNGKKNANTDCLYVNGKSEFTWNNNNNNKNLDFENEREYRTQLITKHAYQYQLNNVIVTPSDWVSGCEID